MLKIWVDFFFFLLFCYLFIHLFILFFLHFFKNLFFNFILKCIFQYYNLCSGMMNAPAMQFIGDTIDVLSKHYPRRLGQLFIINVSSIVFWFWDLISMSLSEVTRKKIQFITDSKSEMRKRIGKKNLIYLNIVHR